MSNILIFHQDALGGHRELIEHRSAVFDGTFWHFQIQKLGIVCNQFSVSMYTV